MDFQFGEKEERFRSEIRQFVRDNFPPDYFGHLFDEEMDDEAWEFSMSISKKLAQKKWLTMHWPEEYGGTGASIWQRVVFGEESGYWGIPGISMGISGTSWVGPSLMLFGTKEQQDKYIPPISAGEPDGIWCTAYSEPDSGSDLASMQTFAKKEGDHYIINGQKVWTSVAHRARWMWMACRTNTQVKKKHHGLSLFIIDMKSKGLTVNPIKNFVGGHIFNEIFFKDVRVPAQNLVGEENNGWAHLMTALSFERGVAIPFYGRSKRIFDELLCYAKEINIFHKPQIRQKFADLAMDLEAVKLLAYEAAWKEHAGMTVIHEPSRDKANVDILLEKLTRIGADMLGAFSQMDPLNKNTRWTKIHGAVEHLYYYCVGMAIAAGTTFTQKTIVGQFGLQQPRSY